MHIVARAMKNKMRQAKQQARLAGRASSQSRWSYLTIQEVLWVS